MGVCYSQEQEWEAYKQTRKGRGRKPRRERTASIIYEEKSNYESSFASNAYASFRQDLHQTISSLAAEGGEVIMGSLVEMREQQLQVLYKSLGRINPEGEPHNLNEPVILCNLKTKNYLHTHKIKLPDNKLCNEVSCCPYTSNHIPEYDIWKMVKAEEVHTINHSEVRINQHEEEGEGEKETEKLGEAPKKAWREECQNEEGDEVARVYIYHPFTQRFLGQEKGVAVGIQNKMVWTVRSFGRRRNGGFLRISSQQGDLCMCEGRALLDRHRRVQLCREKHISHIWELMLIDPELM